MLSPPAPSSAVEVYRRTLHQPYRVHIGRSSSEVISGITIKVGGTMLGVLLPFVTMLSAMMLLIAVLAMLLAIDTLIAIVAAAGFGVQLRRHHLADATQVAP